jgi:hypothetical protein
MVDSAEAPNFSKAKQASSALCANLRRFDSAST